MSIQLQEPRIAYSSKTCSWPLFKYSTKILYKDSFQRELLGQELNSIVLKTVSCNSPNLVLIENKSSGTKNLYISELVLAISDLSRYREYS